VLTFTQKGRKVSGVGAGCHKPSIGPESGYLSLPYPTRVFYQKTRSQGQVVNRDLNMGKRHFVYIMIAGSNYAKIGVASDCIRRRKEIQTGCPLEVKIKAVYECLSRDEAFALEKFWHEKLSRFNTHGEWFKWSQAKSQGKMRSAQRREDAVRIRDQFLAASVAYPTKSGLSG